MCKMRKEEHDGASEEHGAVKRKCKMNGGLLGELDERCLHRVALLARHADILHLSDRVQQLQ